MTVQVTTSGDYDFYDAGYEDDDGPDGTVGVYSGAFSPASPATGCVGSVDDGQTMTLSAGTYTLVLSSYDGDGVGSIPGSFRYTITGPGRVVPSVSNVAAVPTLSEWSIMLLGLGAAGVGMRRLRRQA